MPGGRAHPGGIKNIFYSNRNPVQETTKSACQCFRAQQFCLAQSPFSINRHLSLNLGFDAIDLLEARFQQLQRRQLSGSNPPDSFAQCHQAWCAHNVMLLQCNAVISGLNRFISPLDFSYDRTQK